MAPQALGKSRGERRLAATARATALGGAVRAAARVIRGTPVNMNSCNATRKKPTPETVDHHRCTRPDAKMTHRTPIKSMS